MGRGGRERRARAATDAQAYSPPRHALRFVQAAPWETEEGWERSTGQGVGAEKLGAHGSEGGRRE